MNHEQESLIMSVHKATAVLREMAKKSCKLIDKEMHESKSVITHGDDSCDIQVIIPCVNYSDFLRITLPVTRQFFKSVTVVTTPNDTETLRICQKEDVPAYITNIWYKNGAIFNKAAAMNECLSQFKKIGYEKWILFLDADILFFESIISDISILDKDGLYSIPRRMCAQKSQYDDFVGGNKEWRDFALENIPVNNEMVWGRIPSSNPAGLLGYFQLWHLKYSTGMNELPVHTNAASYDVQFALSFPDKARRYIPNREVLHLGEDRINWNGRLSKQWI